MARPPGPCSRPPGPCLTRTAGGLTETYAYASGTNRLDLITSGGPVDVVTDAAGNTTVYRDKTLAYSQANRLIWVEENSVTLGTYVYSADGRRIK